MCSPECETIVFVKAGNKFPGHGEGNRMSESGEWKRIECEAKPNNMVQLSIMQDGGSSTSVDIPAMQVASVVSALLSAAAETGKRAGVPVAPNAGDTMKDLPDAKPTGLGIMQGDGFNSAAIVLQFGTARLAVRMADRELAALGQALGTLRAPGQWTN